RPPRAAPIAQLGGSVGPNLRDLGSPVRNIEELEEAASGIGAFSIEPEEDGIVRRVPAVIRTGGALAPTLAIEMLRVATGVQPLALRSSDTGSILSVLIGGVEIPTDEAGRIWVRFARHDPALYISAKDILAGRVDPQRLAGKFVFVGTSA